MATIAEIRPRPLIIMAAGHGTRSRLPKNEHKMFQEVGGQSILERIVEAASGSPSVGEVILDVHVRNAEVIGRAAAVIFDHGRLHLSSPRGYLQDFLKWSAAFGHKAFIVDADTFAPMEHLRRFFDIGHECQWEMPALAHTSVNASNRNDPRSAWVAIDAESKILTHARGLNQASQLCTVGLWRTSPEFAHYLMESQGQGMVSITRGVEAYLQKGGSIVSPLVEDAVNVNSPEDLIVARGLALRSLVQGNAPTLAHSAVT